MPRATGSDPHAPIHASRCLLSEHILSEYILSEHIVYSPDTARRFRWSIKIPSERLHLMVAPDGMVERPFNGGG